MIAHTESALEFPPVSHLVEWPDVFFEGTPIALNKVGMLSLAAAGLTLLVFGLAVRRPTLVPTGVQNFVEWFVDVVITEQIAMAVMGRDGRRWVPFLTSIFSFVLFCNLFEVVPLIQMPVTARMATPMFMAVMVWVLYLSLGVARHGPIGYLTSMVPGGVPKPILPLVAITFWLSHIFVQPFSLAVRLFANMLAGHLLLVTFAVLAAALVTTDFIAVLLPLPALMLCIVTIFEMVVAVLQAYIFTMLTAVYVDAALHPHN